MKISFFFTFTIYVLAGPKIHPMTQRKTEMAICRNDDLRGVLKIPFFLPKNSGVLGVCQGCEYWNHPFPGGGWRKMRFAPYFRNWIEVEVQDWKIQVNIPYKLVKL